MSGTAIIMIYTTFPSADEAATAGRALVEAKLAACVNIIPGMTAIFEWQGAVETAAEAVMIIKTRAGLEDAVHAMLKRHHSYTLPAFVMLPVAGGSADYLRWVAGQTMPQPAPE